MSVTPKVQFDDEGLPIPPKQKIDFDDEGLPVPPKVKVPKGAGLDFISRVKDIAVKLISQGRGGELPSEPLVRTAGPVEEKIEVDDEVKLDPNDLVGSFKKNLKPLVKTATPTSDATYVKPSAQAVFNEQERQRPEVIKNLEREKKYKDLKNAFLTDQNLSTTQLMRATGLSAQQIQSASRADLDKMIRPENETDRLAAQVIADTKDVRTAFSNSRSLPEAAIRFAALKDPQVARQIEITSSKLPAKNLGEVVTGTKDVMADPKSIFGEATIGRMIYQLATNPIAVKEIDRNPELKKAFRETVPTLINKYPDFGKAYLGNMISQKMEDMGMNNALLNVVTKEETDKVVESLASEGKMTPNEVQFYKDNMREGGVRNFAKSLLSEQLYKTTGLVERALESAVGAVKATGTGIAEVTGARKALVGERAMTARDIGAGDIAVNVKPRTTISEITSYGGDFLGQVIPTGLLGKGLVATKAFKNPDTAIKALFGLQAYGNYIPQARAMFPGEEVKQRAYAGILAGLEIATENIFRDRKVVEGLLGKVKPEVASVIRQFTGKQISAAAAQEAVEGTIKKALQSVPQYTKYFGKGVGQNTVEETAVQLGQQLTDGVFTGKKFDDWVNGEELLETARTSALGSIFIAGLSARADALRAKGMTAKMIYDMSEKPDYWINAIREGATVDEDLANEAQDKISNLEYAAKVRQDLEGTNLSEKQKIKYLINALEANVKAKNSQAITDPVLKKRAEEEAKVIEQQQNNILDGVDQGEIEGDRSDEVVEAVKEEGEISAETLNKYLSNYKRQLAQRRKELIEQGVKDIETDEQLKEIQGKITNVEDKLSKLAGLKPGEVAPEVPKAKAGMAMVRSINELKGEVELMKQGKDTPEKRAKIAEFEKEIAEQERLGIDPDKGRVVSVEVAEEVAPEVPAAAPVPSIIEVKSPKEVKQGDTVVWRGEDFIVEEVNAKGGFNLRNVADRTNTVTDARITDEEFQGKRGEVIEPEGVAKLTIEEPKKIGITEEETISLEPQKPLYGKEQPAEAIGEVKINSEKVQYNGTNAIGSRERAESDKIAARNEAKEKIKNPETNASLKAANSYNESVGLPKVTSHAYKPSDKALQSEVAKVYPKLQDVNSPAYQETQLERNIYEAYKKQYPEIFAKYDIKDYKDLVKKAYAQLIQEVELQYKSLPVKVTFHEKGEGNYENSAEMLDDVHNFNHLWVYKGGEDHTELGSKTADKDGLTANDKFRAVHDYFGHSIEGYEFGKNGEENAWIEHSKMFSPLAQWALSSETRGQNSFVNYSGINDVVLETIKTASALKKEGIKLGNQEMIDEANKLLSTVYDDFQFAEQKAIVLPPKYTDYSKYHETKISEVPKKLEDAIQIEAAGQVPVQPEAGVSEEVEGGVPPTEPPKPPKEGEGEGKEEVTPGEMVGIKHEATEKMRTAYSLPEYERPEGKTMLELEAEADQMIKDGYDVEALIKKLENAIPPSGVENIILAKYLGALNADFDKTKSKETLAKIERVVNALDVIGTIQSEAFRTRKIMKPKEDTLAQYFMDEKADAGVEELTEEQEATITREYEEIKAAKEALQKKVEELQKENARLLAEGNIAELKKKVKKARKTDADFRQERKNIADSIKEKLKKARNEQKVVVVPYAYELVSISPEVAKLVKSYVEQGIVNLADIVDGIHELLKEEIKDITKKDVQDLIAGEYREKKKTKNQLAAQVRDLKTEARLLNEYEMLQKGEVPVREERKIERNRKLTELKNQIRESDVTKLAEAKESLKKRIAKIEKQMAEGDFEKEPEKKKIKLDEEGRKLQAKLTKLKKERDVRRLKLQYEKQNKAQRAFNKVLEVFNIPRSLMASTDFSAPLNQAVIATINYPKEAREAAIQMVKAAGSQEAFDNWFYDLKETPRYELMNKLKLGITDPFNPEITAREEAFMSGYAEQIPGLGKLVKGSERAYVQYLNKLRVDLFNRFIDKFEADGKTYENNKKLYEATAKYINNITGRGELGPLKKFAPLFNALFFSPRLMAARMNMLNPFYFATLPTELKKQYGKDMGTALGLLSTMLTLFALYGKTQDDDDEDKITVEVDPRSSDFARIKQGDTRWDFSGGFQPYLRLAAQLYSGERKKVATGEIMELDGTAPGTAETEVVLSFFRNKLAPVPSTIVDFSTGKNAVGEKVEWKDELLSNVIPLSFQSIAEGYEKQGPKALATVGLPAIFGVGVSTYGERKKLVPEKIRYQDRTIELNGEQVSQFQKIFDEKNEKNMSKLKNMKEYKDADKILRGELEQMVENKSLREARDIFGRTNRRQFLMQPKEEKSREEMRVKRRFGID